MHDLFVQLMQGVVALRKESVDRNRLEIFKMSIIPNVALRKESVDRNSCFGY